VACYWLIPSPNNLRWVNHDASVFINNNDRFKLELIRMVIAFNRHTEQDRTKDQHNSS
jgi:hypothetical protein